MTKMLRNIAAAAIVAIISSSAYAQAVYPDVPPIVDRRIAAVPFGIGEKGTYKASFSGVPVGMGSIEVGPLDTVRGVPTYHFILKIKGGVPFAKVDDVQESWMDVSKLTSMRFHQDLHQVKYERDYTFEFFPAEMIYKLIEKGETHPLATNVPLDDISFMYWVRTIPLEVGKTYTFDRYFKEDGNPVVVKVLRRQKIRVPAGEYNTIVLQPIIKTKGLFSEGGRAELYFNDDSRRMLIMLNSKLSIGSIKLQLEKYEPGQLLTGAQL